MPKLLNCSCSEWATDNFAARMLGNGHHPKCAAFIPNVEGVLLLKKLVEGIRFWASQEDGVPDELWEAYCRAVIVTEGRSPEENEHA